MKISQKRGFNMLELTVVVGLMGILLAVALPNINKSRIKSRDTVRVADIQSIRIMLEQYKATCGVYPATLEPSANNGRTGECQMTLGDFGVIPEAPDRTKFSNAIGNEVEPSSVYNGYFYAGLSTRSNGPCYDYHVGAELEYSSADWGENSKFFDDDHDFTLLAPPYTHVCAGSAPDFQDDDDFGVYDFRSTNAA